jgi:bacteriocin biosynthesis cyclodehydratase domain-containing protein
LWVCAPDVKLLIVSMPSIGYVRSLAAIARILTDKGHDVAWASGAGISGYVSRTGAKFISILPDDKTEDALSIPAGSPLDIHRWLLDQWFVPLAERALAPTIEIAKELNPDLVLTDATALWGPAAAESIGRPWATYCPGLYMNSRDRHLLMRQIDAAANPTEWAKPAWNDDMTWRIERRLNALRRDHGLPPVQNLEHVSDRLILCLTTRAFEFGGAGLPQQAQCVGPIFGAAEDIDPFEHQEAKIPLGDQPLVYVTLGNVFAHRNDILSVILAGLHGLDIRVVVARARERAAGDAPSDPRIEFVTEPISQGHVLRHASLVVCHGGFNTVQESLCRGVPVIAIPLGADQPAVARSMEDIGLGVRLDGARLTPRDVRVAVEGILENAALRERVEEFRLEAELSNGAGRAVRLLEQLAVDGTVQNADELALLDALPARPRFAPRFRLQARLDASIVLHSHIEAYTFREESFVEAVPWLWQALDGTMRVEDVLAEWTGAADLVPVIATLADKGIVEDMLGGQRLPEEDSDRYADQIVLFSHAHAGGRASHPRLRGSESQAKLLRARVCVVGMGVLGSHVVRQLCLIGIGSISAIGCGIVDERLIARGGWFRGDQLGTCRGAALADQARALRDDIELHSVDDELAALDEDRTTSALAGTHLVILAQDVFDPVVYERVDRWCQKNQTQWTSVRRNEWNVEIGPTIVPQQTGCFLCYEQRRAGAMLAQNSALGGGILPTDRWFHLALGSECVALEALKLLSGFSDTASLGHVLIFNPLAMTLTRHRVLRVPGCPRCSPQPEMPPETHWRPRQG